MPTHALLLILYVTQANTNQTRSHTRLGTLTLSSEKSFSIKKKKKKTDFTLISKAE